MLGEHALAMGIKVLGDGADALFLEIVSGGKWEGIEAARFRVARIVSHAKPAASAQRPYDVNPR